MSGRTPEAATSAHQAPERERAFLAALVESSDDAIVGKTLDGVVTSWNRAAERIFGYSAQEMIGRSIARLIPPERRDDLRMILEAVGRGERVDHYETERVRKDGSRICVSLTVSPIEDAHGRIIGISKIARDVTERHRMDAQREQLMGVVQRAHAEVEADSQAKDEFLAKLAHELRNPLAAIRNAVESAQLDPGLRERALGIAGRQVRLLARLVDDLLDVAQINRGRAQLTREAVSLAELVEHAVESSRFLLEEQGHMLSVALPGEVIRIECDALRIEQVLVNLLSNAAKYTPRSGRIELRVERENGHAVIRVRDDGIGIAGDVLPRIFEPFVQAGPAGGQASRGLGVGLTVARTFVAMHGGTIAAHSAGPGRGAEFVVRLPTPARALERSRASPAVANVSRSGGIRVLVVDDNRDVAEGMAMLLELFGCSVCIAADGPSALEAAQVEEPALMLVDIGLPGMDGYEVARKVRESPRLSEIELVAVTGFGMEEDRQRARAAGFAHHLTKPVDSAVLRGLIASLTAAAHRGPSRAL